MSHSFFTALCSISSSQYWTVKMPFTYWLHSQIGRSSMFTLSKNLDFLWEIISFSLLLRCTVFQFSNIVYVLWKCQYWEGAILWVVKWRRPGIRQTTNWTESSEDETKSRKRMNASIWLVTENLGKSLDLQWIAILAKFILLFGMSSFRLSYVTHYLIRGILTVYKMLAKTE